MKRLSKCLVIFATGMFCLTEFSVQADLEVSASVQIHAAADFYAPLKPSGTWIEVGKYGRCWRPAGVAVGWRPYCYGSWVWTDCGWYWASDEPWAWACYHYGYWVSDPEQGWVWVPCVEWAPAWVSWRFGGGYCGWAPLPPPGVVVGAPAFVFVEVVNFGNPVKPSTVIVNNTTIINETTVIASSKRETRSLGGAAPQRVVINEGPGVDAIRKATGKTVNAIPVSSAIRQTPVPSDAMRTMNSSQKDNRSAVTRDDINAPAHPSPGGNDSAPQRPGVTPPRQELEPTGRGPGRAPHGLPRSDDGERPKTGHEKNGDKGGH